ncbi:MAG: efflux RND transporter periplasmic adaptor subunit [Succinivibrio sp.]|nr:efflux RND transporter periplasmic adaptor subunit [Succinivibrio sp.]
MFAKDFLSSRSGSDTTLPERRVSRHPGWFAVGLISLVMGTAPWCGGCGRQLQQRSAESGPVQVELFTLNAEDLRITTVLHGVVAAYESADIRPQVSGLIREQLFVGGEEVQRGQPLYQIDDRSFINQYDYALAEYHEAQAKLELTNAKLKRYQSLIKTKAVSMQDLEDVSFSQAEAAAQEKIALANLNNARLNLEYTKVLSPLSGIVGKSNVTKGALVTANQTERLTYVVDLSKVYLDLQQPERDFRRWQRRLGRGDLVADSAGNRVYIYYGQSGLRRHEGVLKFSEVEVNESTGNLTLRALFDNDERTMLPGMHLSAELDLGLMHHAVILPERALLRDARGQSYCFVAKEHKAVRVNLELQALSDGRYLVLEGVHAGDKVVTAGKTRVKNGSELEVLEPAAGQGERDAQ